MWHRDMTWTNAFWKKGTNRLAWCRVSTNLQFLKNTISSKHNKVKHKKMRYGWVHLIRNYKVLFYSFIQFIRKQSDYEHILVIKAMNMNILVSFFRFLFFFFLFRLHLWHIEFLRLEVESRAVAASLLQSHSSVRSKPHLQPTPQLMAMQILNPLSKARDPACILMDASQICFCWATMRTPFSVL